jgi:hypothetical protein
LLAKKNNPQKKQAKTALPLPGAAIEVSTSTALLLRAQVLNESRNIFECSKRHLL